MQLNSDLALLFNPQSYDKRLGLLVQTCQHMWLLVWIASCLTACTETGRENSGLQRYCNKLDLGMAAVVGNLTASDSAVRN
jgi:hypothetical protein